MRIISNSTLTALDSGRFGVRCLVKLSPYGSAPVCLWDDPGSIVYSGDTYLGAAGRFQVQLPESSFDLSISGAKIRFSALDSDIVGIIESAQWSQRPAQILRATFATDTPQLLLVDKMFSGFMDRMEWTEASDGSPSSLDLMLESTARELSLQGSHTATDADQRERDASDGIFAFAATSVVRAINWGRDPQQAQPAQSKSGFGAILDHIF